MCVCVHTQQALESLCSTCLTNLDIGLLLCHTLQSLTYSIKEYANLLCKEKEFSTCSQSLVCVCSCCCSQYAI